MRAEGFTRWDAFLRFNSLPRKQVNPLMTQEQEQQLSQTMLAMMQSGGDAPKSTVELPVYAWRLIRWEADVPLTEEQRQEALAIVPEAMALCGVSAACFAADDGAAGANAIPRAGASRPGAVAVRPCADGTGVRRAGTGRHNVHRGGI